MILTSQTSPQIHKLQFYNVYFFQHGENHTIQQETLAQTHIDGDYSNGFLAFLRLIGTVLF